MPKKINEKVWLFSIWIINTLLFLCIIVFTNWVDLSRSIVAQYSPAYFISKGFAYLATNSSRMMDKSIAGLIASLTPEWINKEESMYPREETGEFKAPSYSEENVLVDKPEENVEVDNEVLAAESTNQDPATLASVYDSFTNTGLPTSVVNLLHNSSFEQQTNSAPNDWNYQLDSNTGNTFLTQEGNRSGSYGLKFMGLGGTGNFGISQPNVKTIPGRAYTFSVYLKHTNTSPVSIRLGFWNEHTNTLGGKKTVSVSGTSDWRRISMTLRTPGLITDSKNEFPMILIQGLTSGAVYLDDAQLTEGSILSTYYTAAAYNSSYGIGDGSLIFSTAGDIYPSYTGTGSLGSATNKFKSLYLSNATIESNGDFNFKGSGTVDGSITANALVINGSTILGSTMSAIPVTSGGTGVTSLTQYGVLYGNGTSPISALTPGTSGFVLQSNGTGSAPSWAAASGLSAGSVPFSGVTSGTNTNQALIVGNGSSLTFSGTGTINASTLLGSTWGSPGAIGASSVNTGAFSTLSASGLLSANGGLTIASGQNLTLAGITGNNAALYATSGTGVLAGVTTNSSNLCLVSGASSPTWQSCALGAGTNFWNSSNGSLYPGNSTLDLFVGGTATTSAKFAVLNVAGGTPTASISANSGNNASYLTGDGTLATTNRNTLTIGNSSTYNTTGNVLINPNGTGNVGIGIVNPGLSLSVKGTGAQVLSSDGTGSYGLRIVPNYSNDKEFELRTNNNNIVAMSVVALGATVSFPTKVVIGTTATFASPPSAQLYVNGNVGIGTTSPLATLDVRGNSATTPAGSISANSNFASLVVDNTGSGDLFTASKSGASKFVIANNGNVGIGTTTPATALEVNGNITLTAAGSRTITTPGTSLKLEQTGDTFGATSLSLINRTGQAGALLTNSGLGLTDFTFQSTAGAGSVNTIRMANSGFLQNALNTTGEFHFFAGVTSPWFYTGPKITSLASGKFGIGTTSPLATLDVRGNSATTPAASVSANSNFAAMVVDNTGSGDLFTASKSGATKFTILNNGNVEVRGTATTCTIGDGTSATNCSASDQRLKENIATLSDMSGLDAIKLLNPVSFNWNPWMQGNGASSNDQFGFIAQDVAQIFPNLVQQDQNTGFYKLDYQGLFAPVIKSIQDLDLKIAGTSSSASSSADPYGLTATLSTLQTQIGNHGLQISDLQSRIASLSSTLLPISPIPSLASSSAKLSFDQLDIKDATVSGTLSVLDRTLLSDVSITGNITSGLLSINGLDDDGFASINTSAGALKLQSHGLYGLDMLNGKVTIAENGDIKTEGNLTAKSITTEKLNITSPAPNEGEVGSFGEAVLLSGTASLTIETTAVTSQSGIFITADSPLDSPLFISNKNAGISFTVSTKKPEPENIKFHWWVVN